MNSRKSSTDYISPLEVPSGAIVSPQRGNLTGIPRKVRDNCAELHNLLQRWKVLNVEGFGVISTIADLKQASRGSTNEEDLEFQKRLELDKPKDQMEMGDLQTQCENLYKIHQKMTGVVNKMKLVTEQFKSIILLYTLERSREESSATEIQNAPFQTWPVTKYWEVSNEILTMFEEELESKQKVLENIAHTDQEDDLVFLSAVWTHEPYLKPNLALLIESMLVETKHK